MNARNSVAAILVAGLVATNLHLPAQTNAPAKSVDERIETLEKELQDLKQQREQDRQAAEKLKRQREADQQATQKKAEETQLQIQTLSQQLQQEKETTEKLTKQTPTVTAGPGGFIFKSADEEFALRLHGLIQVDGRFYLDDKADAAKDTFLLRKIRPIIDGTVYKDFDFRFMPDFGGGSAVIQDSYVNWAHWPELKLRIGKFKSPMGLEALQEDAATEFAERALPFDLLPFRDVGVQLSGDLWGGVVTYAAGVFNGVLDGSSGDLDNGDDKDYEGRIFAHPFRKTDIGPLKGFGFGIAGAIGDQFGGTSALNLPTYKTMGQQTFFSYITSTNAPGAVFSNGRRTRWSPQAYYYWGPVGLLGEYAVSEQEVQRGVGGSTARLRHDAWQVAGSVVLTGEQASFKGVTPKLPFFVNGGWGALELVGRFSQLSIDSDAFPTFASPATSARRANEWSVGFNWYLNKNIKFIFDYDQTDFDGGAAGGGDRPSEKVLFGRAQVAF